MPSWSSGYKLPPNWKALRAEVLQAANYACVECGAYADRVDHKRPVARGGTHDRGNLQAMCRKCHWAKTRAEQMQGKQIKRDARTPGRAAMRRLVESMARKTR